MRVVTHNDGFHADDVFAMATLNIFFGSKITEVIRTRDEDIIESADIVFDVGGMYDESKNRFDHHQKEDSGRRENNVPYAAFGLVWKKWGKEICLSQEVADIVDSKLIQSVDASDNGYSFFEYTQDDIEMYSLNTVVRSFCSTWKEVDNYDETFLEVVKIAQKILEREIKIAQDKIEAIPLVQKAYDDAEDKRLIVLDEYYPWGSVLSDHEEVLFVISPNKLKTMWRINAVQSTSFVNRKDLPTKWAGLRDTELEKVSGVLGAVFCHRNLFMAATCSKDSALLLAKKALES